jgi:hypothetical protein
MVAGGLGRLGEVALAVVVLQRHAISVPKTTRSGKARLVAEAAAILASFAQIEQFRPDLAGRRLMFAPRRAASVEN